MILEMKNDGKRWQIQYKSQVSSIEYLISILLKNRGIQSKKDKEEFLSPKDPYKIGLTDLGVKRSNIKKCVERIKKAKKSGEHVFIYGDYDADGISATAVMWEALHNFGIDVLPYIPDRFADGYGIKAETVEKIIKSDPKVKLIITVDNGIVGYDGIEKAKKLGVDVIVIDHHTKGSKKLNTSYIIHTTSVCGSALAWFFAKEIGEGGGLELAAIGTIADQMPLTGANRSIVKFGISELSKTKRPGLRALFENAKIKEVGTYEINYLIAPRINAMGRLGSGLDSLRLLCTKSHDKAKELATLLGKTNYRRQEIVDQVVQKALEQSKKNSDKLLVIGHETFHEGVIGLAAGKLVEEFYKPAIVLSEKGDISKASARSISGFNIIEAIRATELITEGGGHPMAAGFSIETKKITLFSKKINEIADKLLTDDLMQRKLKIDCEIDFSQISQNLHNALNKFEPSGLGNPTPTFVSRGVELINIKQVGKDFSHLKLRLRKNSQVFDAIFFGGGEIYSKLTPESKIDVVYQIEENVWNGNVSLQLKVKDIR